MDIEALKERLLWDFIMKRPIMCGVKITSACNLRCLHCPFHGDTTPDLDTGEWINVFKTLENMGVVLLNLEGGEPFTRPDLPELVDYMKEHFYSGVTTNGTFPIETNADIVWVSVDGMGETHDQIRGKGVWDKMIKNIMESSHPNIHTNSTLNNLNYRDIPQFIQDYSHIIKGFSIEYHYPYPGTENLSLKPDKRKWVTEKLIQLKQQGYPIDNSESGLRAMGNMDWGERCQEWAHTNVDPNGTILKGCYIRIDLGEKSCEQCGYHCYAELSLALEGIPDVIESLSNLVGLEF